MNKNIFCANCQKNTDQTATVDGNGEYVFTCACGRFIKFAANLDAQGLTNAIADHQDANIGQVSLQKQFDILSQIADTTAESQSNDTNNIPA